MANRFCWPVIVAAIVLSAFGSSCSPPGYSGSLDSIVLAWSPFEAGALLYVAEDQRFFGQNGLEVTPREYDLPIRSLDAMLKGEADIVAMTEFPLVGKAFQKARIRAIGTIAKSDFIYLIGRRDRGIEKPSDLKGKKVGVPLGTIIEFYLGRFLELNSMNIRQLNVLDFKTLEESVNALVNGDIDAIVTAQPYVNLARDRLGANAFVQSSQSGRHLYALVVSTEDWIAKHPGAVKRFLASLAQAEEYLYHNPAAAKTIVRKRLNYDEAYVKAVWSQNEFYLSLDQSLVTAMEDEARWMIKNNLTAEKVVPNFNDYIDEHALKAIKPGAVNIIR